MRGGWEWAEARLDKDQDPGRVEGVLGKCLPHRGHGESFHTLRWPCLAFRDVPGPERPDRAKLEATADVFYSHFLTDLCIERKKNLLRLFLSRQNKTMYKLNISRFSSQM